MNKECNLLPFIAAGLVALLVPACAFAQPPTQPKPTKPPTYCPKISELRKDPKKRNWYVGADWKSYGASFATKIVAFYGAQWVGAKVGQMTCLYQGAPESFRVLLIYNTLTDEPKGGRWSKNLGGYFNCVTPDRTKCPFKVRQKPIHHDLFKELEQLKNNSTTHNVSGE